MSGNLVSIITPDNFTEEILSEKRPVLVLCMPNDDDFPSQLKSIEAIARRHGSWLKVGVLGDAFIENFKARLGVAGTPTFLIFIDGEEKTRMLGLADHQRIEQLVLENTGTGFRQSIT